MPFLRAADFADVPADRIRDRVAVCGGVSGVWHHASDREMAVFYVLDRNSDGDRPTCAAAPRPRYVAGIRSWAAVLGFRSTRQCCLWRLPGAEGVGVGLQWTYRSSCRRAIGRS